MAVLAVTAGVTLICLGGWRTGVSWDETYHVLRMRNFLEHGWYLLDGDLNGSVPGAWENQEYVYAPVTMLLMHGWLHLWGVDAAGSVPATAQAYAVRHLLVGVIALVGVVAAAGVTRVLLRRWSWGLVTAGVLLALPVWAGHAMFNVKDVPVATGYTLVTLGLALLVTREEWLGGGLALLAGSVLAVGTRPGIWPGLALSVVLVLALLAARRDWPKVAVVLGSLAAAYGVLLAAYPAAFSTPIEALVGGALESSRYGGTKGHWWYLPLFLGVEIPTGYLVLGVLGTVVLARVTIRHLRSRDDRGATSSTSGASVVMALVGLQCFALPVLAVLRQSNIYTGVRQMLFAAPMLAVLVTVGIAWLLSAREHWPRAGRLLPAAIVLALALPLVSQLQLFPYSYAYSSVPANVAAPAVPRLTGYEVPTDYWRTSVRELAPAIPEGGWVTCSAHEDPGGRYVRYSRESHDNCVTDVVGPLAAYGHLRAGTWEAAPTRFLAVMTGTERMGENCRKRAELRRWLHWRRVLLGYVAECELVLDEYPEEGLRYDGEGDADSGKHLLGGWHTHASEVGIGVRGDVAELGFWLPEHDQSAPLVLTGRATGATGLRLLVNGSEVTVRVAPGPDVDTFRAVVPAGVAALYGEERMVVGFADDEPSDGELRLLELHAGGAA